ncbi:MAG: hypothetical protein A2X32_06595 [Elusimicrobia bacterium GWC2_64_44]|nr:MAG: hypothetical protein A2X32_06595 [Elusimicrobia bacterium GWC2_64_44]
MKGASLKPAYFLLLAGCLAAAAHLGAQWERKLAVPLYGRDLLRAQSSEEEEEEEEESEEVQEYTSREKRTEKGTSQKIYREGAAMKAQYGFVNFNKDRVTVSFGMTDADFKAYTRGYGYSDTDLAKLRIWRDATRTDVWNETYRTAGKAAAERAIAEIDLDYDTKLRGLLRSRGLAMRAGNVVENDIPVIVKKNIKLLNPLANAFQKIATERKYSEENLVGAVVSMVQTAIRYKIPPNLEGELHTCGLLPPARSLLSGWGDCDTKSALLGSILGSWSGIKMVGVAVPGHYLMAIRRLPGKGDMFVRHGGLEYVLVEAAGPAWLEPGMVGEGTKALLAGKQGYRLEPFF